MKSGAAFLTSLFTRLISHYLGSDDMQIITMIFSGLALLAATVSLILTIQEKKRNKKRNAAALRYTDETVKDHIAKLESRIEKLEQGITPDYERAKAAANAVNDFNRGITNILNFDPLEALRKERNREAE